MQIVAAGSRYISRLALYLGGGIAGSMVGSIFTWRSETWVNANPVTSGVAAALLAVGPALAIAAIARLAMRAQVVVSCVAGLFMLALWWLFASNESSTSSLVFVWGWLAGIPVAVVLMIIVGTTDLPSVERSADRDRSAGD